MQTVNKSGRTTKIPAGLSTSLGAVLLASLAACGGGSASAPAGTTFAGAVMDGYIKGATVCLDLNGDGVCGTSEPKATTGAGGAYSFTAPSGTDLKLLSSMHLIADVPTTAVDEDSPNTTVTTAYKLLGPASTPSVVSPLTTAVSAAMKQGQTLDLAKAQVRTNLGMSSSFDLMADYVKSGHVGAHNVAKLVAAKLAASAAGVNATNITSAITSLTSAATTAFSSTTNYSSTDITNALNDGGGGSGSTSSCTTSTTQQCYSFSETGMAFTAFGGGMTAALAADPTSSTNKVAMYTTGAGSPGWGGVTLNALGGDLVQPVKFSGTTLTATLKVYSPQANTPILLKFENASNGGQDFQVAAKTTKANTWETLTFDFSQPIVDGGPFPHRSGTYNANTTYNKVSIFPDFATSDPKPNGAKTYYFDDLTYATSTSGGGVTPPVTQPLIYASGYKETPTPWFSNEGGSAGRYIDDSAGAADWWSGNAAADATPNFYFGYGVKSATKPWGFGAFVNAPNNGTANVSGYTNLQLAVWSNDQLADTKPTYTIVLKGPSVNNCAAELQSTAQVDGRGAKTYTLPLSAFTVKTACAYSNAAAILAAGVNEVHIQVLGTNVQYVTSPADAPGFYANGMNVGPISFR